MKLKGLCEPRLKPHGSRLLKARPTGLRCRFVTMRIQNPCSSHCRNGWHKYPHVCVTFFCMHVSRMSCVHNHWPSTMVNVIRLQSVLLDLIIFGFKSFRQPKAIVLSQHRLPWSSCEGQSCPPKAVRWTAPWAFLNTSPTCQQDWMVSECGCPWLSIVHSYRWVTFADYLSNFHEGYEGSNESDSDIRYHQVDWK